MDSAIKENEVRIPEIISSNVYPLSKRWLKVGVLKQVFAAVGTVFLTIPLIFEYLYIEQNVLWVIVNLLVFIPITIVLSISVVTVHNLSKLITWCQKHDYTFTKKGVVGSSVISNIYDDQQRPFIPYHKMQEVYLHRSMLDRLFGYAVLHVNRPFILNKKVARIQDIQPHLIIRGLKYEEAVRIRNLIHEYVFKNYEYEKH